VVAHLGEHPDAEVFTSLPRSGQVNAAQLLAEWGDCRQAYPQADSVAMLGGLCPVTHASGRHRDVSFRWACNKRLRQAMTCFANNSRRASPWAAELYRQAIARGCDHPHAVRILARAWARVIWRCWQDRTPLRPGPPPGRSSPQSRMRLTWEVSGVLSADGTGPAGGAAFAAGLGARCGELEAAGGAGGDPQAGQQVQGRRRLRVRGVG
jgi:hypothetical protein